MSDTKKEIKGFFLYKSQCEAILRLPDAQIAGVIRACFAYIEEKDADLSDPMVGCAFELIRPSLDMAQKRAQAGHKGGEAKANNLKQTLANSSKELANSSNDVANSSKVKQTVANKKLIINNKNNNNNTPPTPPSGGDGAPSPRLRFTKADSLAEIDGYTENQDLRVALSDFVDSRQAMKKPLTARALKLTFGELDKLAATDDALKVAIVNQSVLNGWQGLFPLKEQPRSKDPYEGLMPLN